MLYDICLWLQLWHQFKGNGEKYLHSLHFNNEMKLNCIRNKRMKENFFNLRCNCGWICSCSYILKLNFIKLMLRMGDPCLFNEGTFSYKPHNRYSLFRCTIYTSIATIIFQFWCLFAYLYILLREWREIWVVLM